MKLFENQQGHIVLGARTPTLSSLMLGNALNKLVLQHISEFQSMVNGFSSQKLSRQYHGRAFGAPKGVYCKSSRGAAMLAKTWLSFLFPWKKMKKVVVGNTQMALVIPPLGS